MVSRSSINDASDFIADPVEEQFFSRFTLLRKRDFYPGLLFPEIVSGAETAVTIAIWICRAVFLLPDVLEIYPFTGQQPLMDLRPVRFFLDLLAAE